MAEGVLAARGSSPLLLSLEEAPQRWDDLNAAYAIIFGAPTYMVRPRRRSKHSRKRPQKCCRLEAIFGKTKWPLV
ncbi:MAG: hypothetical protein B7Y61_05650 [Rhizobiales bacterium 35-66-30]|nr:MAG: hypothetical protein B7Y61_05650 [Rhizobiales bacterium 35-66-30]